MRRPLLLPLLIAACSRPSAHAPAAPPEPALASASASASASALAPATASATPPDAQLDPDGDDDPSDPGAGDPPTQGHFARVGRAPLSLLRICDLTVFHDALYAAHATTPLGSDGATIMRYVAPDDGGDAGTGAFSVVFDWNRPGEPTKGGGGGQGFLRVHAITHDGVARLFVADADPPYGGLGLLDHGTEGYVFVSDAEGRFARARNPGHLPPAAPTPDGGAGASVIPRAYHDLDVVRFRGRLLASTGAVPPDARAWRGPSPGALHVASPDLARFAYETDFPHPYPGGVWRLTYLVRFHDRLYAGIQDYDGVSPDDYVVFDPPRAASSIGYEDAHPANVTGLRGTNTLRWYADGGRLFWIAWQRDGDVVLRVTRDGDHWEQVALPFEVGRPTDIVRWRGALFVLGERALVRLDEHDVPSVVARVDGKRSPFVFDDLFCAAPLAVYRNRLYAGGQRDGALHVLDEE
ncbi:MAG TPA: hypothetical protein VIF09_19390 [Polyangiaceae bacterium]|jgi:hypothetical protein